MKLPVVQVEAFEHRTGQEFKGLPEIYQVELTNRCNLKCPMCLRTTDMDRPDGLFDLALLERMIARGDFAGSFYTELQMAGEPTLHPELRRAIELLRDSAGVMTGLSTHGLLIGKKSGVTESLLQLDALTISVDSVDPDTYHKLRYPAKIEDLWRALDVFFAAYRLRRDSGLDVPFVELQLVDTAIVGTRADVPSLELEVSRRGWNDLCSVRTTADCFSEMSRREEQGSQVRNTMLCINPFSSVSVAYDGTVVSCCFIFDPKPASPNVYGNLNEQSLADIWAGDRVAVMRAAHMHGVTPGQCARCYLKSPVSIHLNIVSRLVRARRSKP